MYGWVLYRMDERCEELRGIFKTEAEAEAARSNVPGSRRAWKIKAVPFVGWTHATARVFGQDRERYVKAV